MPVVPHCAEYLRKREAEERELAEQSTDPDAKEIYLRLARWYRTLAENAEDIPSTTNQPDASEAHRDAPPSGRS